MKFFHSLAWLECVIIITSFRSKFQGTCQEFKFGEHQDVFRLHFDHLLACLVRDFFSRYQTTFCTFFAAFYLSFSVQGIRKNMNLDKMLENCGNGHESYLWFFKYPGVFSRLGVDMVLGVDHVLGVDMAHKEGLHILYVLGLSSWTLQHTATNCNIRCGHWNVHTKGQTDRKTNLLISIVDPHQTVQFSSLLSALKIATKQKVKGVDCDRTHRDYTWSQLSIRT